MVFFFCSRKVIRRLGISIFGQLSDSVSPRFFVHHGGYHDFLFALEHSLTSKRFTTRTEQVTKCYE